MYIREVEIKGFGKFHDKLISLGEGINIIEGDNESGKSTITAFIQAMLFGMERGRGRASREDMYTRYQPWESKGDYGGRLDFIWEGRQYRISRDFTMGGKAASFTDLETGADCPYLDQKTYLSRGLTLSNYQNTVGIHSSGFMTDAGFASTVQDSILNLSTGQDGSIAVSAALRYLEDKKKKIALPEAEKRLAAAQTAAVQLKEVEEKLQNCRKQLKVCREKSEELLRLMQQKTAEEQEELIFIENEGDKRKFSSCFFWLFLLPVLGIVLLQLMDFIPDIWKLLSVIGGTLLEIMVFVAYRRYKTEDREKKGNIGIDTEVNSKAQNADKMHVFDTQWVEYGKIQEECGRLSSLAANLEIQADELEETGNGYHELKEQRDKKLEEVMAAEKAAELLRQLSAKIRSGFSPKFAAELGKAAEALTCGEYTKVFLDEHFQMKLEKKREIYPLSRFSKGTAEQISLALRIAASKVLYRECSYPMVLDDALVNFDQKRLRAALAYLKNEMGQVLLFSCGEREAEELDQLSLPYRYISLSDGWQGE